MDTKEEVLEEIEELEDVSPISKGENKATTDAEELVIEDDVKLDNETSQEIPVKKNKAPLIILLSILLILDIMALVVYIIGIDKVISFIK